MKVPSPHVQCCLVDVLTEVCMKFPGESSEWVLETLNEVVPVTVLTTEGKTYLVELLKAEHVNRGKVYQEFEILARRARS